MKYMEKSPSPLLFPHVLCYWVLEGERAGGTRLDPPERVFPDGCMELVFHRLAPFACGESGGTLIAQPRAFLFGQLRHHILLRPARRVQTIGVRFRPAGVSVLLGLPADEITHRAVPIDALWGHEGSELEERVLTAPDVPRALAEVDLFLRNRLPAAGLLDPRVSHALDAIAAFTNSGDTVRIGAIARSAGLSERHLERRFHRCVGLGPKRMASILRFQHTIRLMRKHPVTLTEAALNGGYFDQAHFTRSFRKLAGVSPRHFLRRPDEMAQHFISR